MSGRQAFQAKESAPAKKKSSFSWLRPAAAHPAAEAEHEVPSASSPAFAHDFTKVPVRPMQLLGVPGFSCPFAPQRCPSGGACHACPPKMQAKLKIGQPGDRYEQEADRVAEQVMRMPEPQVQRKCLAPGCKDEEEKKLLQTKSAGSAGNAQVDHPLIQSVLSSPGQPLDAGTRSFMEPRFGQDFSGVRVHVGGEAAEAARAVNARAYTVGRDVVFGEGQYAPGSDEGRRLMAHELTHVRQQSVDRVPTALQVAPTNGRVEQEALQPVSANALAGQLQRDLATPEPAAAPAQLELTNAQVQTALAFNRTRYTKDQTMLIQDIVGTESTGVWSEADIHAVADIQQRYQLKKDGIVGFNMFNFLNKELRRERLPTDDAHCLTSFFALGFPAQFQATGVKQHQLQGHFQVQAQFPQRCNCADFEYRQFIRGHFVRHRGGVETDLSGQFTSLPAGSLTPDFREDGDTSAAVVNYGHRADPPDTSVENHYIDDTGADDQANGCRYRNEDLPGWITLTTMPGDEYEGAIQFRGELQRGGRAIRTLHWNGLRGVFRT